MDPITIAALLKFGGDLVSDWLGSRAEAESDKELTEIDQGFQEKIATQMQEWQSGETAASQEWQTGESEKERDFLEALQQQGRKYQQGGYQDYLSRTAPLAQSAESQFLQSTSEQSPVLQDVQKDIVAGHTEGQQRAMNQMKLNLAEQGVRGSQAATLQNRQSGQMGRELQRDVNLLKYEEEMRRRNAEMGYKAAKAGAGAQSQYLTRGQGY